jgi:hypothetical protein
MKRSRFILFNFRSRAYAAAARCHAIKAAFEERLEKDQERARSCHLLSIAQLFTAPELARGDIGAYHFEKFDFRL